MPFPSISSLPHPALDTIYLILTARNTGLTLCQIPASEWTVSRVSPYSDIDIISMIMEFDQRD